MSFLVRGASLGAAALLLLAGCGDDPVPGSSPSPAATATPTPSPSPESDALDAQQVKAALLAAEDLPEGWSRTGGEAGDSAAEDSADTTEPARCGELFGDVDTDTGTVAEAEADFENKQLAFLTAGVASFEEEAAPQLQQFEDALRECPRFTSTDKDGLKLSYKAAPLDFPALGDRTVAVRMTGEAEGIAVKVDVVLVALGRNAVSVIGGGLTPLPAAQLESIARKAVAKVEAAA